MKVSTIYHGDRLSYATRRLAGALVSPMCGLSQRVSFMTKSRFDPSLCIAGGELTGIHLLRDPFFAGEPPNPLSYHIGGGGVFADESYIRCLGETVERYSQLTAESQGAFNTCYATYEEMLDRNVQVLELSGVRYFTDDQLALDGFRFSPIRPDKAMTWIETDSVMHGCPTWVPAQLLVVGYQIRKHDGEDWLWSAVTTGTATHPDPARAFLSSLLELVQIDATVGHWYSGAVAPTIRCDSRTTAITALVESVFRGSRYQPRFHVLPSSGFPCHAIACVARADGPFPAGAVGLGCSTDLEEAMYKALIECVGVVQLAKIVVMTDEAERVPSLSEPIWDFNTNVALYASPKYAHLLDDKFVFDEVPASSLPDFDTTIPGATAALLRGFSDQAMELVAMNMTTPDTATLGLHTLRAWSPDLLGLPPPSAPPAGHQRFDHYGGIGFDLPHPYA